MKKITFVLLGLMLTLSIAAQQANPVMSFTKTKHDFGNLKQENGPASVKFTFTNTGSKPLIIQKVNTSCGCTTPNWTRKPVAPGKTGFVEAVYDPRNRPGHFTKTVTVYSNAANSPITLTITGNVLEKSNPLHDKYPQRIGDLALDRIYLNFGNILNDEKKTKQIKIYNTSDREMKLLVEDRYKPYYTTVKIEPEVLKPHQEGTITVTYDASKVNDWDYVRGFMYLTINGKRQTARRIQISAIIKEHFTKEQLENPPRIEFEETSFNFDTIQQGQIIEHVFKFKNTGKGDLIIRKTRSSCGCTAVSMDNKPIKPGETGSIKATFNSTHKRGRQTKLITIITNCPEQKYNKVILRIEGYVKPKKQPKK